MGSRRFSRKGYRTVHHFILFLQSHQYLVAADAVAIAGIVVVYGFIHHSRRRPKKKKLSEIIKQSKLDGFTKVQ
jgi:hypothetical protein